MIIIFPHRFWIEHISCRTSDLEQKHGHSIRDCVRRSTSTQERRFMNGRRQSTRSETFRNITFSLRVELLILLALGKQQYSGLSAFLGADEVIRSATDVSEFGEARYDWYQLWPVNCLYLFSAGLIFINDKFTLRNLHLANRFKVFRLFVGLLYMNNLQYFKASQMK